MKLILLAILILLTPIADAVYDNKQKELSKILRALQILIVVFLIGFSWKLLVIAVLIRLLFHDYIWAFFRKGVTINYLGSGIWDKYIAKYVRISFIWFGLLFLLIILILNL